MRRVTAVVLAVFGVLLVVGTGCTNTDDTAINVPVSVDGRVYNEKFTCNRSIGGGAPTCVDVNVQDTIEFTLAAGDTYVVRDVPDTGFLCTGTFSGLVFNWTATSPGGYTESGAWTFASNGNSFAGSSTYIANDLTYSGQCKETGTIAPNIPADPGTPLPTGCP